MAAEAGESSVGLEGGNLRGEPLEQCVVPEVAQSGGIPCGGDDPVDVEVHLHPEGELVEGLLVSVAHGLAQVCDPHFSHDRPRAARTCELSAPLGI